MKNKYNTHKSNAKKRGIEFLLTFEEWSSLWINSGKYENRGRGKDKYCMCRINDVGPYSVDNVFIDTNSNNLRDGNINKVLSEETKQKISVAQTGKTHEYALGANNVMHRPEVKAKMSLAIGGSNNYKAKTVSGPYGIFGSAVDAFKALNIPASTIQWYCRENKNGWSYLPNTKETIA